MNRSYYNLVKNRHARKRAIESLQGLPEETLSTSSPSRGARDDRAVTEEEVDRLIERLDARNRRR